MSGAVSRVGRFLDYDYDYEVDPTKNGRDFGCAKSLELAELREVTAAIVESSLRSFPGNLRLFAPCSQT